MRTLICFTLLVGTCLCSDCPVEQEELGSMCANNDFAYCATVTSYERTTCIDSQCVFWTAESCSCTSDEECQSVLPDETMCYNGQCVKTDLLNGETCLTNSQCLSKVCNSTTSSCQGVGYGEVCLLVGCEEGLTCYLNSTYPPTCGYPKSAGENCTTAYDDNECQNGLICAFKNVSGTFQKVCQPYKTLGEECVLPQDCASGLTCITVNKTFTCEPPMSLGSYCNTNHDCESAAFCNFGTCEKKNSLENGSPCLQDLACASNLCLFTYEDGETKAHCASNATGSISTGDYCNPLIPQLCDTGYCSCTGWSETGACVNAICECPLKEGDSCVGPGSRCANGLICGYEGKCVKLFSKGNGATCMNNFECELCRYCSDDGECSSHTGDSCFDSIEFYQGAQTSIDFMHAQVEKADTNEYCVNGKTCQCDGSSKKCESAGHDWEMVAQNWFTCSQFGSHFGTSAMTYTCGFVPDVYEHNPPASQLSEDCQQLIANYFCCTWYTTLFVEKYTDGEDVENTRASLNGYLDYNVDCTSRTLTDVVFEPCCGSNNLTGDCPYWVSPVFSNWEYTFSLVNTTKCKSYAITSFSECSDDDLPWALIIAGIIGASVMFALLLGFIVWFVRRKRKPGFGYTTININGN